MGLKKSMSVTRARKNKSVLIVGLADQVSPTKELLGSFRHVWAINNAGAHYGFKPDRIIAMDDLARDFKVEKHKKYVRSIVDAGCPVYSARAHKRWPSVRPYPLASVLKHFRMDESGCRLFDNTVNYAFALALAEGYTFIGLYGIWFVRPDSAHALHASEEHFLAEGFRNAPRWFKYYGPATLCWRRPLEPGNEAVHYWLGYARAKGINIWIQAWSPLMNNDRAPYFYGYQEQPEL